MALLVEFLGVSKKYRKSGTLALDGITFNLEEGERIAYLGPNGSGKTTTCKIMSTVLYPDSGKVLFHKQNIFNMRKEYLKKIGVMFGNKTKLMENIKLQDAFLLLGHIYGIPEKEIRKKVFSYAERLNVGHLLDKRLREFSLGERTKSELIGTLLHDPEMLILDEPTIGVDIVSRYEMYELLRDINKTRGISILITSHNVEDIKELAERVILINKGKVVFDGGFPEFKKRFGVEQKDVILRFRNYTQFERAKRELAGFIRRIEGVNLHLTINDEEMPRVLKKLLSYRDYELLIKEQELSEILRRSYRA